MTRRLPARQRPDAPGDRLATGVGILIVLLGGAGIALLAFGYHPVGDYFTESDFYGAYVGGARALARGTFDASRYGVYGPGYEVMLAAVASAVGDAFLAARILSVASAIVVLATSWYWARGRLGAGAAAWLAALLAVNPTFVRYGYSATTDMLSFAGFSAGLAALLAGSGLRSAAGAGLSAGLAALTRYNLASLLPGALLTWLGRRPWSRALAGALLLVAVFTAVITPFTVASLRAGHVPGVTLVRDAGFYLDESPATTLEERYGRPAPDRSTAPVRADAIARRLLTGIATHTVADARTLLGWPAALLALAGLIWSLARRRARPLGALLAPFAFTFLALAPVFHSERYSMVLLPLYLAPAALLLGHLGATRTAGRLSAGLAGLSVLVLTSRDCVALQRLEWQSLPVETLAAGRAIHAVAARGDRVLARKAHTAYAADLQPVLFPEVPDLAQLGEFCRREHIGWLYYSWYELRLRPQFGYLLDSAAVVPGLTVIHATTDKPSVTYRVGPELGETPAWWHDDDARAAIRARVNALMVPAGTMGH